MTSIFQTLSTTRWLKNTLISLIVIALLLILLPFGIQWGAEYALKKQGASEASIEDVNLNVFNGTFELKKLHAVFAQQPALTLEHVFVDVDMAALWSSKVVIEQALIDGLKAQVKRDEQLKISINGYSLPESNENVSQDKKTASEAIKFALQSLVLSNSTLSYSEQGFKQHVTLHRMSMDNLVSWDKQTLTRIKADIEEGSTRIKADIEANLVSEEKSFVGDLSVSGLNTQPYQKFYQQYVNKLEVTIDVTAQFNMVLGEQLKGSVKHTLSMSNLHVKQQQLDYKMAQLSTEGNTNIDGSNIIVDAQLAIKNSVLMDEESASTLNVVEQLTLNNFYYDGTTISFADLSLSGITLLDNKDSKQLLSLSTVALQSFTFNPSTASITLKQVELQQPNINVILSEQKTLTHLAVMDPILQRFNKAADKPKQSEQASDKKPLVINVEKVHLTKAGLLNFKDLSVSPFYSTTLHFNSIVIDRMSSETPADFKLALKQGEYTSIDINGKGLLFNPTENLSYTIDIKQLDLPPVSSYTAKTMGYGVKSGVVDTVIKGSIKQQQIDTNVVLIIDSIDVVETNKETAAEISGASGMSIGLALSTLKDKNNMIDLELPIGGNIKKPDFDLSLIINKAMGIAMKTASLGYLKHALQPFSGLVSLFSLANDVASSISLAPIGFSANNAQLEATQKELLDKVSNILNERPGIKIKTCSISSLGDQNSIKEQLLNIKKQEYLKQQKGKKTTKQQQDAALNALTVDEKEIQQALKTLADQRSAQVKRYLTGTKKIDSARVLNCLSASNQEKDSKPVVELVI